MKRFRITRLEVNEIGPFGQLTIDFPDKPVGFENKAEIHILTGENGMGKTTVLEMLLSPLGSIETLKPKFKTKSSNCKFAVYFYVPLTNEPSGGSLESIQYYNNSNGIISGSSQLKWLEKYRENLQFGRPLESAVFGYSGYRKMEYVSLEGVMEPAEGAMNGVGDFNSPHNSRNILQWILNLKTKAALSLTKNKPELALQYENSIRILEKTIESIIGTPIHFVVETEPYDVKVEMGGVLLDFRILPDGLKSSISWLADLLVRMDRVSWINNIPIFERNFILFLDEIEVHMHPAWQRKILPAVQGLFPNAQIFISTHSPFVVNSVDGAWIHRFEKSNGDSRLAGPPILSEDGKSISYVLEEIFNVPERYGPGAMEQLKEFYQYRDIILKGANGQTVESVLRLAKDIALQSDELRLIMEMELRQINRRKQLSLTLD